MNTIYALRLS